MSEDAAKRFVLYWLIFLASLALLSAILNALVDPYLLFNQTRIVGLNARKPAIETQDKLMKAYDVARASPKTLILGTSMLELGFDANSPTWPLQDRPVYNLSLRGSGPYTSLRYLQHVLSRRDISLIVMGVDFQFFLHTPDPNPIGPDVEKRLAAKANGTINEERPRQMFLDFLHGCFSMDALSDTIATLTANRLGNSSDIDAGNWENSEYFRTATAIGAYKWMRTWDQRMIHHYWGLKLNPVATEQIRTILDIAESRHTRIILIINPVHADELEMLDLVGGWESYELWTRQLVELVEQHKSKGRENDVTLWDFSGYNSYSSEPVVPGRHVLRWFRDSSHYTREMGGSILARIFGEGDVHFGAILTTGTIDGYLAGLRRQRAEYRRNRATDVERVRSLYLAERRSLEDQLLVRK